MTAAADLHGLLLAALVCLTGFAAGTNLARDGGGLARGIVVALLMLAGLALWGVARQTNGLLHAHLVVPLAFVVLPSCAGLLLSIPWTAWRAREQA